MSQLPQVILQSLMKREIWRGSQSFGKFPLMLLLIKTLSLIFKLWGVSQKGQRLGQYLELIARMESNIS